MKKKRNNIKGIRKTMCDFIKIHLISYKHKAQFESYIATGNIDDDIAVELYDNILYNLQLQTTKTISLISFLISIFVWEIILFPIIVFITAWFSSINITYYTYRIFINKIYPNKYNNGSNKNYLLMIYNPFKNKESSKIQAYIIQRPVLARIGEYGIWRCIKCKKMNLKSKRTCFKCNYERNWLCIDCNTLNISNNLSCIKCNTKKNDSEYLKMHWKCNKCNEENQNTFTHCWKCSKEKQNRVRV